MLSFEMGLVEQKDVSAWIVWEAELTEECGPEIINQKHKKRKRKLFPGLYDFVWYGHAHLLTFANQLNSFILSTTIHLPYLCMDMFFSLPYFYEVLMAAFHNHATHFSRAPWSLYSPNTFHVFFLQPNTFVCTSSMPNTAYDKLKAFQHLLNEWWMSRIYFDWTAVYE